MYASYAPQSLISYRDLRVNNIHISTALEKMKRCWNSDKGGDPLLPCLQESTTCIRLLSKQLAPPLEMRKKLERLYGERSQYKSPQHSPEK